MLPEPLLDDHFVFDSAPLNGFRLVMGENAVELPWMTRRQVEFHHMRQQKHLFKE